MIRAIQRKLLVCPVGIGDHHIEAPTQCDDHFLLRAIGVPASRKSTGHVIGPEHPCDLEREMIQVLQEGQVASGVVDTRQLKQYRWGRGYYHGKSFCS